jgi:transposase
MSEALVRYVAEQIGYEEPLGKKGESGILQTKATRAAFLSNPEHRICFYYAPIHCSWMNQIEIWFGILNRQLLRRKSFVSVESLEQCIRAYIVQYNKYFAHPFKWTYASVPEIQREDAV